MCVLLRLNPNWLSFSGPQESSDSSNTTVEDEDVKGKTDDQTLVTHVFAVNFDKFWMVHFFHSFSKSFNKPSMWQSLS